MSTAGRLLVNGASEPAGRARIAACGRMTAAALVLPAVHHRPAPGPRVVDVAPMVAILLPIAA